MFTTISTSHTAIHKHIQVLKDTTATATATNRPDRAVTEGTDQDALRELVDTVLLSAYLIHSPPLKSDALTLLTWRPDQRISTPTFTPTFTPINRCHIESAEMLLLTYGTDYICLLLELYRSRGLYNKVLKVLCEEENCVSIG